MDSIRLICLALSLIQILQIRIIVSESISGALEAKLTNYDKRMTPTQASKGGGPVEVEVSIYVLDIGPINEDTMDFTATFYFRQHWKDERMANINLPDWDGRITLDADIVNRLWIPDTFFTTDKDSDIHTTTTLNSFTRINPEGEILRSIRVSTKSACAMDLHLFPMDTQICSIEFESYGYTMQDVHYSWRHGNGHGHDGNNGVGITQNLPIHQHILLGHRLKTKAIHLSTGNYSRLAVEFVFERVMSYYILNLYLPAILLVLMSSFSFGLGPRCSTARAALTATPVLSLSVLMAGIDEVLPPVSYVRAIDVFLVTCFILVLGAVILFAATHQMYRAQEEDASNPKGDTLPSKLDKYAKFGYPIFFALFNLLYWAIYLNMDDDIENLIEYHD